MDAAAGAPPMPSVAKACSRCRLRKVKCDMQLPQCTTCLKNGDDCNMMDCVSYPYSEIQRLQLRIRSLQERLHEADAKLAALDVAQAPRETASLSGGALRSSMPLANGQIMEDVRKEAEEIGVLAVAGSRQLSSSTYVGSSAGSTFVRMFLKQLRFESSATGPAADYADHRSPDPTVATAGLPSVAIAQCLLRCYIAQVHVWWPLLSLPVVRRTFHQIYKDPQRCSDFDKFLVFVVLALASTRAAERDEYRKMHDLNTPLSYFQTSLRFFDNLAGCMRDLSGIQALVLVSIWMTESNTNSYGHDLWQLSRYTMSLAIEIGLHRHNKDWQFSADDLEIRNRTWWCVYALERQVAVITGRVLSVRDHAVQALMPTACSLDQLTAAEAKEATTYGAFNIWPFNHLIQLRRIAGRVLESVYIARGADGRCPTHTFQEICALCNDIHRDLEAWKKSLDESGLKSSREHAQLKIEFCVVLLLLNRPSPTFMVPSRDMLATSSRAASSAIRQWRKIAAEHGISAVCRCYQQFHQILLVGMAALYCDWQYKMMAFTATASGPSASRHVLRHEQDAAVVCDLMEQAITFVGDMALRKYRDLFNSLCHKVYDRSATDHSNDTNDANVDNNPNANASTTNQAARDNTMYSQQPVSSLDILSNVAVDAPDTGPTLVFTGEGGPEEYRNQVTGFLDAGVIGMDNIMAAWYDSIMEDTISRDFF